MLIARILVGGLLLVFGRKLFWLFVAASGFAAGLFVATRVFDIHPEWAVLLIGLVLGVVGAIAAVFIQRVAIGVAGFLTGALIAVNLAGAVGMERGVWFWAAVAVGGVVGAILVAVIFDWALIVLSSLYGASIALEGLRLTNSVAWVGLLVLFIIGIMVQVAMMRTEKRATTEKSR
jgi:hypothetical protein